MEITQSYTEKAQSYTEEIRKTINRWAKKSQWFSVVLSGPLCDKKKQRLSGLNFSFKRKVRRIKSFLKLKFDSNYHSKKYLHSYFRKMKSFIMCRTYGSLFHFIFLLQRVKTRCYKMCRAYGSAKTQQKNIWILLQLLTDWSTILKP